MAPRPARMLPPLKPTDEVHLAPLLGAQTVAKGRAYAEGGAVVSMDWAAAGTEIAATVQGTESYPYEVSVVLQRTTTGRLNRVVGDCSCPMSFNCKHVAAALIAACRSGPGRDTPRPARAGRPAADAEAARPGWEVALQAVLSGAGTGLEPASRWAGETLAIGLQFEAVASRPGLRGNPAAGRPGLRVRPVSRSLAGHWVRTGISWVNLDYLTGWRVAGPAVQQVALLKELRALARLGDPRRWTGSGDEAVWLESVASRRVWDLLHQIVASGVPLISAGRDARPVVLAAQPVDAALDVTASTPGSTPTPGGDLQLRAHLLFADHEIDRSTVTLVGTPPHGVAWTESGLLHLAALDPSVPAGLAGLVAAAEAVRVPAAERAAFEAELYPTLRRRVAMRSSDGSVDLPPVPADEVVCSLSHLPGPALEVAWGLQAGAGRPRPIDDDADADAEKALAAAVEVLTDLPGATIRTVAGWRPAAWRMEGLDAARFMVEVRPRLAGVDGIRIEEHGQAPDYREVHDVPQVRLASASGAAGGDGRGDWLDLHIVVTMAGEAVPFTDLFVALAEGRTRMILPSGTYFRIDQPELRRLADLIEEARSLHDAPPERVRLSRFSASLFEDLSEVAEVEEGSGACFEALRTLAADGRPARPVPAGLVAELRPYQAAGFSWLAARYESGVGAVLADDMGLGKTLQALALVCHAREQGLTTDPFLVVAPTSVVGNWVAEASRFAPGLRVVAVSETTARRGQSLAAAVAGADLVVTSYSLFRLDHAEYGAGRWAGLLLDEAQFVKNPGAITHIRARRLDAPWKLAMTGTPLENSLTELWAITAITAPGLLGRPERFAETYRLPIERNSDPARLDQLRRRIRPVMLRRTKAEVIADLPDKQEQVLELELVPRHRKLYQMYLQRERQKVLGLIDDMKAHRFEILRSLTILRQAALHVALVDPGHAAVPSSKLDLLTDMLTEAVADGHRVLVFSQFTRFLSQARQRAEQAGMACCYLDGRTRRRQQVIDAFRAGEAPVFMISLKAGGFGLNLTEADHCILLDPWWNPATEAQAVDRVHRIGQTRKVMVHRLVAVDTIEEKVMALKARKSDLFSSVMEEGGFANPALQAADVAELLT